jgi:hypothetical protein
MRRVEGVRTVGGMSSEAHGSATPSMGDRPPVGPDAPTTPPALGLALVFEVGSDQGAGERVGRPCGAWCKPPACR